jgi:hypothetical protein
MKKMMLLVMAALLSAGTFNAAIAEQQPKCKKECCKKCDSSCKEKCSKQECSTKCDNKKTDCTSTAKA